VRFLVRLDHPKNKYESDLMSEVARFHGDGIYRGSKAVTLHQVDDYGLDKLERELTRRILTVSREDQ
jgi:hypothetical protein